MRYLMVLGALLCVACAANAADVRGVVHYADGSPIVGATLIVRQFTMNPLAPAATRLIDTTSTGASGEFSITLRPGHYSLALVGDRCSWPFTKVPLEVIRKGPVPQTFDMRVARDVCADGVRQ